MRGTRGKDREAEAKVALEHIASVTLEAADATLYQHYCRVATAIARETDCKLRACVWAERHD